MAAQINFDPGKERKDRLATRASILAQVCSASACFCLDTTFNLHHAPTAAIANALIDASAAMQMEPFW